MYIFGHFYVILPIASKAYHEHILLINIAHMYNIVIIRLLQAAKGERRTMKNGKIAALAALGLMSALVLSACAGLKPFTQDELDRLDARAPAAAPTLY